MKYYFRGYGFFSYLLLVGLCVAFWISPVYSSDKLIIAREGKTPYVVVQADQATDSEKLAIRELTTYLRRVTGASYPVVMESAISANVQGIYVGWTKYMATNGIDGGKLGAEEWVIRSVGNNLILTGGRPRGTLYAVYEFLENQMACHWLDRDTEIVPARPDITLPKLQIQGKPTFWGRKIYLYYDQTMPTAEMSERQKMFMVRNKSNSGVWPEGGFYQVNGSPGSCHTFADYVNAAEWFEKDYPDILVQTFAYVQTQKPPKTLKPRRNVMIRWCDVYSLVDLVRPLSHPYNSKKTSKRSLVGVKPQD